MLKTSMVRCRIKDGEFLGRVLSANIRFKSDDLLGLVEIEQVVSDTPQEIGHTKSFSIFWLHSMSMEDGFLVLDLIPGTEDLRAKHL